MTILSFPLFHFSFLLFSFFFFIFLHSVSFSFFFCHVLSCSIMFFFFLFLFFFFFFSFCRGLKICFLWPQFRCDFSSHFLQKNIFRRVWERRGWRGRGGWGGRKYSFEASFPFLPFFHPFSIVFLFLCLGSCSSFLSFSFSFSFSVLKNVSLFVFSFLAFVSGINKGCFLRGRRSMEMWCPDDIGRDSWDWVKPPAR